MFYVAFNPVQVISQRVVGRAEETSTYSSSGFCTVNCRPTASNNQLSHLRPCRELNPSLRGGRRECYHSATAAPLSGLRSLIFISFKKGHTLDNRLTTLSSWLQKAIPLCYKQDQQALDLAQVKAHDIRAFTLKACVLDDEVFEGCS